MVTERAKALKFRHSFQCMTMHMQRIFLHAITKGLKTPACGASYLLVQFLHN